MLLADRLLARQRRLGRCVRRGLARLSIVIAVVLPGDCVVRDQPLMELDVAVVADGDDAAGALAVVLTERDVLLDDLLQLIAPGGEPIRFGFELFGPIVRFEIGRASCRESVWQYG